MTKLDQPVALSTEERYLEVTITGKPDLDAKGAMHVRFFQDPAKPPQVVYYGGAAGGQMSDA